MAKKVIINTELQFPADLKNEPVFYHMIKKFDVIPNILEASFSTEMGWALVKFEGSEEELTSLFEYLRSCGVSVDFK